MLTYVIGSAEDLPDLRALEDDPRDLEVAELDVAVREAAHHHEVLGLKLRDKGFFFMMC